MKYPLYAILFFALLAVSCAKRTKSVKLIWQTKTVHDIYCADGDDQQACTAVDLEFPLFASANAVSDSLNELILAKLCSEKITETPCQDAQSVSDDFIAAYKIFLEQTPDYQHGWELSQKISVIRETPAILSLVHESYAFTGGAHGMSGQYFYNIDLNSGQLLALADIIKVENKAGLLKIAHELFYEQRNIPQGQSLEQAGYWFEENKFYLPENYTITDEGLYFLYNPYEIASYADGKIELFIPNSEINSMLILRSEIANR